MNQLDKKVSRGLSMTLIGQFVAQAIQFPTMIVLARLLTPAEFGLVGQVAVFTGVAYFIADLGLGTAVVQRKELDHDELSTIYWINAIVGVGLALFFCAAAPAISAFYDDSSLVLLTMAMGSTFLFSSLRVTQYNLLRREMSFGRLATVDALSQLGASAVSISMAANGLGVWALVGLRITRAAVPVVVLLFLKPFRPRFTLQLNRVRDMLKFGGFLLATTVANYGARNGDKLLVGKMLGEQTLGLYLRAYDFMLMPVDQISRVVSRVMIPAMSRAQDDVTQLQSLLLSGLERIAFFSFPVMTALALHPEPVIVTLFGEQWSAAAPILSIFCAVGLLQSVLVGVRWVYVAIGRTDRVFRWQVSLLVMLMVGAAAGLKWGVEGVAWGIFAAQTLMFFPMFAAASAAIQLPGRGVPLKLSRTLVAALGAATGPLFLGKFYLGLASWQALAIGLVLYLVLYLALASALRLPVLFATWAKLTRRKGA